MLNKSISFKIFVVIFAVGLLTQCNAQEKANPPKITVASTGSITVRPADEAIVEIVIPDYEVKEATLESLQSLPTPNFNLIFKTHDNFKTVLPADVKSVLDAHWKAAIKFFYEDAFDKPKTSQEGINRDTVWTIYCQKTQRSLQERFIEAPNGNRKISQTEAEELYGDLNKAAVDIVKQVEKLK